MKGFRAWCEIVREEREYFKRYKEYAKKIKEIVEGEVGDVDVIVFGSVVEGKATPKSDIDVLVVSENMPSKEKRGFLRAKILKEIGLFSPFEIHLVNKKEFEWYRKFLKKYEAID
ncbi:DNA polymerase subunit beta [Archaeoglobales archaeon]|nr:MAG: DNA polymerase subunit beta [Archaeoglobales archaeon]